MLKIGISGQAGSGKSTLAEMLSKLGLGENVEVDTIGHNVLSLPEIQKQLCTAFGNDIIINGKVSRRILGRKAFVDQQAIVTINQIMHPAMRNIVQKKIAEAEAEGVLSIIINAALLYSMGLNKLCNTFIYVVANPKFRLERLVEKRKWTQESAKERLFAQDKAPNDSSVIMVVNDNSLENLQNIAKELTEKLKKP